MEGRFPSEPRTAWEEVEHESTRFRLSQRGGGAVAPTWAGEWLCWPAGQELATSSATSHCLRGSCTVQGLPRWVSLGGEGRGDCSCFIGQARWQAAILCKGLLLLGSKLLVGRRALPHGHAPTVPHLLDIPSPDAWTEGWGSVPPLVPS